VNGGIGTNELAENASKALQEHRACIAKGHGVFTIGATLEEAYVVACMVEHSSKIKYLVTQNMSPLT